MVSLSHRPALWAVAALLFCSCARPLPDRLFRCEADGRCAEGFVCWPVDGYCHELSEVCEPACAEHQACDRGECKPRYAGLSFDLPSAGALVGQSGAKVRVRLQVNEGQALGAVTSVKLRSYEVDEGAFVGELGLAAVDAGIFEGIWPVPAKEERYRLEAELFEGQLKTPPLELVVDLSPPDLALELAPPSLSSPADGGTAWVDPQVPDAYRRDEVVGVKVRSTAPDLDPHSVRLTLSGLNDGGLPGASLEVTEWARDGGAWEGVAELDLSQVPFPAFRGQVSLSATGEDLANNPTFTQVAVPLTRWKWVHQVPGAELLASPAVGGEGTLYLGIKSGTDGELRALRPDGTLKWSSPIGPVEASPAVGRIDGGLEIIYAAANTATGSSFYALDSVDGGALLQCDQPSMMVSTAISIADTTDSVATRESGITVLREIGGGPGLIRALRPGATPNNTCRDTVTVTATPANVAVADGGFYFAKGNLSMELYGYAYSGGNFVQAAGYPASFGIYGAALAYAEGHVLGAGVRPSDSTTVLVGHPLAGGPGWAFPLTTSGATPAAGNLIIASGNRVLVSAQDGKLRRVKLGSNEAEVITTPFIQGAMVAGQGGLLYSVSAAGTLTAWDLALAPRWSLSGLTAVEASPNLDCSRDERGTKLSGRPGVLYVAAKSGSLYAFVVDARGIDLAAPWPKYQHDPRNTGNAETSLQEFACP